MKIFNLENKKIIIVNFIIIIVLALLSVLMLQKENLITGLFTTVVVFDCFILENIIKNYNYKEHNEKKVLVNIFTQCCIYIIIYGLILVIFKVGKIIIAKIVITHIFTLIYYTCRHYISKTSHKKQVIFYILFFFTLIGMGVYGISRNINTIDILVYTIILASSVSALFAAFIFIKSDERYK